MSSQSLISAETAVICTELLTFLKTSAHFTDYKPKYNRRDRIEKRVQRWSEGATDPEHQQKTELSFCLDLKAYGNDAYEDACSKDRGIQADRRAFKAGETHKFARKENEDQTTYERLCARLDRNLRANFESQQSRLNEIGGTSRDTASFRVENDEGDLLDLYKDESFVKWTEGEGK